MHAIVAMIDTTSGDCHPRYIVSSLETRRQGTERLVASLRQVVSFVEEIGKLHLTPLNETAVLKLFCFEKPETLKRE